MINDNEERTDIEVNEMQKATFVHLHVLTCYSLGRSVAKVDALVKEAKKQGMQYLALTDVANMFAVPEFFNANQEENIIPIIGSELQIECRNAVPDNKTGATTTKPLVVLATSLDGYNNLLHLVSLSRSRVLQKEEDRDFEDYPGFLTINELKDYHHGLIALSGGPDGEISQALLVDDYAKAKSMAEELAAIFKDKFYLEIQHHGQPSDILLNSMVQKLSQETGISMVATNEVRYVKQEDGELLPIVDAIKNNKTIQDNKVNLSYSMNYELRSASEMKEVFSKYPSALANTLIIAKAASYDNWTKSLTNTNNFFEMDYDYFDDDNIDLTLKSMCEAGLKEYYPNANMAVKERVAKELKNIYTLSLSRAFIFARECLQSMRKQGFQAYAKEGPIYGSFVAYLLDLTPFDPIKWHVDSACFFYHNNEEQIKQELMGCVRGHLNNDELKQCLEEVRGVDCVVPDTRWVRLHPRSLCKILCKYFVEEEPQNKSILKLACRMSSLPIKQLARGSKNFILLQKRNNSKQPLLPLQVKKADFKYNFYNDYQPTDHVFSQYDHLAASSWHFETYSRAYSRHLKLLENIQHIFAMKSIKIDFAKIPLDDMYIYKFLQKDSLQGLTQNAQTRSLLRELNPQTFNDLIIFAALSVLPYSYYPLDYLLLCRGEYWEQRNKQLAGTGDKEAPLVLSMEPILAETKGLLLYEEQVQKMLVASHKFTELESVTVVEALRSKNKDALHEFLKAKFPDAQDINLRSFIEYVEYDDEALVYILSNCPTVVSKAEMVAKALEFYQRAYLKYYYPLEYMEAFNKED